MADRRQQPDRRRWRLRRYRDRRQAERPILVLELTSHELNIVELHRARGETRDDRLTTSSLRWRQSAASLHAPQGAAELAAAFREIARRHPAAGAETRLVLSGEFCVVRTLHGSMDEVQQELQQLEQRSRLYLSLGAGDKVLVSSLWAVDARHAHATAAVCHRGTLEAIRHASAVAGLEIQAIEPALCALARSVKRLPAAPAGSYLLININPPGMEIGVCHEGQLLLDYRPGGRTASVDVVALLSGHLNRLSRHVGRRLRLESPEIRQVFLSGDESSVREAALQLGRCSTLEVYQVRPDDIKATWALDAAAAAPTAVGLGGLLAAYLPEGERAVPNLMKHILDSQREPLRPILVRSGLPVAAMLMAAGMLAVGNVRQQSRLDVMQAELDALSLAEARARELRLQLTAARGKLIQLEKLAEQLPSELGDDLIQRIAGCMPSDVWLSQIEISDKRVARLQGASYLEAGVYDFVRWLEQAPGLEEVALKGTSPSTSANGPITNFELELRLSTATTATEKVAAATTPSAGTESPRVDITASLTSTGPP